MTGHVRRDLHFDFPLYTLHIRVSLGLVPIETCLYVLSSNEI